MPLTKPIKQHIEKLKKEYDSLSPGKESLLTILAETELSESVYNSNAIENSTLTLKETEKILLEMEVSRQISLREVYEAKNLARVFEYIKNKTQAQELDKKLVLFLHQMLINGINDEISGRFRRAGEYVRVGAHIAPAPEKIEKLLDDIFIAYSSQLSDYFLDKITKFHLAFEYIHPFIDGNGRLGRVIINYQLMRLGFPSIIIRDKEKQNYYQAFRDYDAADKTQGMEKIIALAVLESLHKRIAYLKGNNIIALAEYIKRQQKSAPALLNAARRQNIPAFREKGVWKISSDFTL